MSKDTILGIVGILLVIVVIILLIKLLQTKIFWVLAGLVIAAIFGLVILGSKKK
jgi:hypothetical protein